MQRYTAASPTGILHSESHSLTLTSHQQLLEHSEVSLEGKELLLRAPNGASAVCTCPRRQIRRYKLGRSQAK